MRDPQTISTVEVSVKRGPVLAVQYTLGHRGTYDEYFLYYIPGKGVMVVRLRKLRNYKLLEKLKLTRLSS
jgi:hypothetical protein